MFTNPQTTAPQQPANIVAKPAEQDREKDWLLDPMNLYLRGMAQRRE